MVERAALYCPRGSGPDSPFAAPFNGEMHWRDDETCSYCGSLHPDTLMARIEAGDVELGPTDKGYKVYVDNKGGEPFRQTYRNCPRDAGCTGPDNCSHWVTREASQTKFYFQHLSAAQRTRFVELLNQGKMHLGFPGYFYTLPFFIGLTRD